ncbi:DUF3611 family protein [Kamptonema formosum]|uniref:DUF3611 family protein n=1 Tax=Kamptonema formosum TaxID=331992 RepID=UPI00034B6190|nr:DUF3611 family protein [Oscillatoria sp. PCC 10802]
MQTQSDYSSISPAKQKTVTTFRLVGWMAFWLELALALASGLVLLFAISGQNFAAETNAGIGIGIFWAIGGVIALLFNTFLAFRYTRIAKGLENPNTDRHPKKGDTVQLLRLGLIVGLVGIFLCLVGAGSTSGVLVAKAVSQPPGVAISDPNRIIRALDVFVEVANINGIAANFVAVLTSLGLLNWIQSE